MGWAERANDAYMPSKSKHYTLLIKLMVWGLLKHDTAPLLGQRSEEKMLCVVLSWLPWRFLANPIAQLPLTSQMLCSIFNTTVETLSSYLTLSSTLEMSNLNYIFFFFTWDKVLTQERLFFSTLKTISSLLNRFAPLIHFAYILSFQRSIRQTFPLCR